MIIETELEQQKTGFYHQDPEEFLSAIQAAIARYKAVVAKIKTVAKPTWDNAIQPLEEASENLDRNWSLLEHENAVSNTPEIRHTYEELLPLITNLHTEVLQDQDLYNIYVTISQSPTFNSLTTPQRAIIQHALRNFKLGGVNLPAATRAKLKELHERLSALENNFANNVLDATEGWSYHVTTVQKDLLEGLPERVIAEATEKAAVQNKSGWILTLDQPTLFAILSYAQNRQLREEFYVAYYTRASDQGPMAGKWDNTKIIAEILQIRQEIAHLTGYANYAEYSLVPKMAPSTTEVNNFLHLLVQKVKGQATREYAELKEFAREQGFAQEFSAWDMLYYAERMRESRYSISEEELRIYFPETRVLSGLFKIAKKLFGIEIQEVAEFAKWHPSVRMFSVIDEHKQLRGHFYIDLYTREGKRGGAWMAECISRIRFADTLQTPIAYLNCNFAPPNGDKPGLLTHDDVVTLFHEFGHTLHHVLTQIDYYSVAGMMGVAWDAVELPSQFMENWAWDWNVMCEISENIYNGEHMPRALFDRLLASRNFHAGLHLLRQLTFSIFDFRLHENSGKDVGRTAHQIAEEVRREVSVVPTPEINRFENSFGHIFPGGYAAGYYSYLWAEVLSCDAYEKFIDQDLAKTQIGKHFLREILEKGGSEPAMDLFVAFAGRKPEVDALLRHHAIDA